RLQFAGAKQCVLQVAQAQVLVLQAFVQPREQGVGLLGRARCVFQCGADLLRRVAQDLGPGHRVDRLEQGLCRLVEGQAPGLAGAARHRTGTSAGAGAIAGLGRRKAQPLRCSTDALATIESSLCTTSAIRARGRATRSSSATACSRGAYSKPNCEQSMST